MKARKGKPIAKPALSDQPEKNVFGCMAGTARIVGDVVSPVVRPEAWNAVRLAIGAERRKAAGRRRRAGR
jgi:hypothetical protein